MNKWKIDVNIYEQRYLHENDGSINIKIFPKISVVFQIIFKKFY